MDLKKRIVNMFFCLCLFHTINSILKFYKYNEYLLTRRPDDNKDIKML